MVDQFAFDATADEVLVAQVRAQGLTAQLSLLDSQGQELVQSDGLSSSDPDNVIAQQLVSGTYFLKVDRTGGGGTYALTTSVTPTTAPYQPLPVGASSYPHVPNGPGGLELPLAIVAEDFTGKGREDLAVANYLGNQVSVLRSNGDGSFQPQVTYAVGLGPDAIVAGDFTGNGILDLAVANYGSNTVSILLGNGDGTFQPQVAYAVGYQPEAIVAGDFTGNGILDLAVANFGDNDVSILLGNGNGTFQPQVTYAVGQAPTGLVAGDFNGDGRSALALTDIYLASGNKNPAQHGWVSVLLGNGDGTFQPQATYAVGQTPEAIVAGDFRGDGRTDLAVVNANLNTSGGYGTVSVLLGNGDGTFRPQVTYEVGGYPMGLVAGDFTSNGITDLAVGDDSANDVSVLLGNGDGAFQTQVTYLVANPATSVAAGDFTGNGRTDLAFACNGVINSSENTYYSVSVLLGNGDGAFQTQVTNAVGTRPGAIVTADFTGDGRTDLAVANENSNTVSVLLGNGDGTFQPQVTYAVGSRPDAIVAGDFNGDGRLDLAVANEIGNTVSVLLGNGDGTFQPQVTYAVGSSPTALVAGDFTGNGILDLAVSDGAGVQILLGNGDGTFKPPVTYAVPVGSIYTMVAGDFTGNGRIDLAVVGDNYQIKAQPKSRCCWATAMAPFQPATAFASGGVGPNGVGRLHRRRPRRPRRHLWQRRGGAAEQRRRHLPEPGRLRGGRRMGHRGGRFHRRRSHRPRPRQLSRQRRVDPAGQWRRHVPGHGHLRGGVGQPKRPRDG